MNYGKQDQNYQLQSHSAMFIYLYRNLKKGKDEYIETFITKNLTN